MSEFAGQTVSKQDGLWFGAAGILVWALSTVFYAAFATAVIEHAFWFYVVNVVLIAGAFLGFFHLTARFRRTPKRRQPLAALVYAAPGLGGALLVAMNYATLLPGLQPESLGRYGALVLVSYGLLLAMALERPVKPL